MRVIRHRGICKYHCCELASGRKDNNGIRHEVASTQSCTDGDTMSIGRTVDRQASYDGHGDNCSSSTSAQHLIRVVAAAAATDSHPIIADDLLLGPSGAQRLRATPNANRRRSYSASHHRPASPVRASSGSVARFLSPDYGSTPPGRGRPSKAGQRAARRGGDQDLGGGSATKDGGGTTIKRSLSATLAVGGGSNSRRTASTSSFGSGLHLGSSVTFFNTFGQRSTTSTSMAAAEHHTFFADNSNGPRRSCSITLAHPSDCVLLTTDVPDGHARQSAVIVAGSGTVLDHQASSAASRRNSSGRALSCRGRLTLAPPVIKYDAVRTMPQSPTQRAGDWSPGSYQIQSPRSRNVLVTPRGSFLAVNQSPIEFRESMLSISYPNITG